MLNRPPGADGADARVDNGGVGSGIRRERLRRNLTLAQLANRCGLTPSALSQIERGLTDPSMGSFRRIAAALEVPLFQFLSGSGEQNVVVRRNERRTISFPHQDLAFQMVTPDVRGDFEILSVRLAPRQVTFEQPQGHDYEECDLILSGEAEVEVAGRCYRLSAGDAIKIHRNLPHRVINSGTEEAEVLMVISPHPQG